MTNKCFIGGMDEQGCFSNGPVEQIACEVADSIRQAGAKGLMIGPGCVAYPNTPSESIFAACAAVKGFKE